MNTGKTKKRKEGYEGGRREQQKRKVRERKMHMGGGRAGEYEILDKSAHS